MSPSDEIDDSNIPYVDPEEEEELKEIIEKELPKIIKEIERGEYITGKELLEKWIHERKVRIRILSADDQR